MNLLSALDTTRAPGWLSAESHIRNYGEQARKDLAKLLSDLGETIERFPTRYFAFGGDGQPLFVWMQSAEHDIEWQKISDKASAVALSTKSPEVVGILVQVSAGAVYREAQHFEVHVPSERTEENARIFDDAKRISQRTRTVNPPRRADTSEPGHTRKTGRNEQCPCGSGMKFKKCHGR